MNKERDKASSMGRMPILFVGHGSPLNVINGSSFAKIWREIGLRLPKPRAIVCMSAHWLTDGTYISGAENPVLIYDFFGFPSELYQVTYPAKGEPDVAEEILSLVPKIRIDHNRGLDHGAWTILKHLFPNADVPVLQLSIDFEHSRRDQFNLVERLKPLRDKGILFVGSGNIVHNLGQLRMDGAHDWALEFDALSRDLIENHSIDALIEIEKNSALASLAIPMDDHYRPLLNTLALMDKNERIRFFNEEIDFGSVSMRSFITQ